ncbi:hypothetical protein BLNAU_5467 [Blattamonas nauphoetae]|uniref:Uncharacterized protein n=1 Tax=Blattamonas nauphoetae TaxID=2049346 RepID=A0ABQ9Y7L1_9EUKA|nr:hypothetical protein BLNAU_5467 [Blattamonas nauphoetae]
MLPVSFEPDIEPSFGQNRDGNDPEQYLPNSQNFRLLPLFTTILQRHPPSLPHLLSSPLWLSLPSILVSPPQSPSTLQRQPQPRNDRHIEEQPQLCPVLAFINSILQLCLTSSPPTLIPNKTLLSSSLTTLSSHSDPLVKVHSGSALHSLTLLDSDANERSMPLDEIVAQRDALRIQIGEKDGELAKMTLQLEEKDVKLRNTIETLRHAHETIRQQAAVITELTKKAVTEEARLIEAFRSAIAVSSFSFIFPGIGVIDSSQFEQCKISDIIHQPGSSVFVLSCGSVHQNGRRIAEGNQAARGLSEMTLELDMNRRTLVLFVNGQRQPHSLANIPQKVRFALSIHNAGKSAEIQSPDEGSARIL